MLYYTQTEITHHTCGLHCKKNGFDGAIIFFFNDTATTEIYTLSLHDALPIYVHQSAWRHAPPLRQRGRCHQGERSEEHTSELQSQSNLVCRLLLEKKKNAYDCL